MKLREIADLLTIKKTEGNMDIELTGLQMDSRKVEKGHLFICVPGIRGFLEDRHSYASDAVARGAVALIVERDVEVDVPKIFVKDARYAMAVIASHFYGYPSHEMKLIGITGTNGKTTTSYILEKLLADYGQQTGLMGNNGIKINKQLYPTDINTQEPPTLQQNLRKMRDFDTNYCIMEVTSQGLDMGRVVGCHFRTAIFTNLTQDHLDYHGTFVEYRNTKGLLFSRLGNTFDPKNKQYAILNADDPAYEYYRKITTAQVVSYGMNDHSDVKASQINLTSKGITFKISSFVGDVDVALPLIGKFNIYNTLAAVAAALVEGVPLVSIKKSLSEMTSVSGRMDLVNAGQDYLVVVDYAHTPDALENVLSSLKEFATGKILTVFGCGGDRDITKRPIMGEIAGKMSDFVIVTSDNPRSEDPVKILKDIEDGMPKTSSYKLIVDRSEAIRQAIQMATSNDIVLIAGKGHETYQIFKDETIHFDDREEAMKAILGEK
jgi:UDP-N-acetylmuramoyl-L-alanyl-D-glutamate--2,6-diaminopimelate ligase